MITDHDFYKDDIVEGVLDFAGNMEIYTPDALVTWAVDATLRYVVEWLRSTGHAAKAEILESIGEVD